MRRLSIILLLAASAACSGTNHTPSTHPNRAAPTKPTAPSGGSLESLPIAQYLGHDDQTGQRVRELLSAIGIESSAGGSLGYSVWVRGSDRAKAREILLAAASSECLAITLYDDQGAPIAGTQPPRCAPAPAAAPSGGAK